MTITATFSEDMVDAPAPKIAMSGIASLLSVAMTKIDSTTYTYLYTVGSGYGTATISLSAGTDLVGNVITSAPSSGASFTVNNASGSALLLLTNLKKMLKSSSTTSAPLRAKATFIDIEGSFARNAVEELYEKDIVQGRSKDKYEPDMLVTRAEALKIILLTLQYELTNSTEILKKYSDTDPLQWYAPYIATASKKDKEIVTGYVDGMFKPHSNITRAELIKILISSLKTFGLGGKIPFKDVPDDAWYAQYVEKAYMFGIIKGRTPVLFEPNEPMTRGKIAIVASRALKLLE